MNRNGRLEVIGLADDGALGHAWQAGTPPFWSSWEARGRRPAGFARPAKPRWGRPGMDGSRRSPRQDGAAWRIGQLA
jgi:hypothetical protein